ncbi:MAG: hypothetical protein M1840_001711 [Geoglossum simile]|nr:MAG: hypothetical protein M1840_001711 [Geoglossum simile]
MLTLLTSASTGTVLGKRRSGDPTPQNPLTLKISPRSAPQRLMAQSATFPEEDLSAVYDPPVLTLADIAIVASAKELINNADRGVLTPETFLKFQQCIYSLLDISPNPASSTIRAKSRSSDREGVWL